MSHRRHLLSALAALTFAAGPAVASDVADGNAPVQTASGETQDVALPLDIAAELARIAAFTGGDNDELARRLSACLTTGQLAEGAAGGLESLIWRTARNMECLAAIQLAQVPPAETEIY